MDSLMATLLIKASCFLEEKLDKSTPSLIQSITVNQYTHNIYNDGKLHYINIVVSQRCVKKNMFSNQNGVKFADIRITSTHVASINQLTVAVASKGTLSPVVT